MSRAAALAALVAYNDRNEPTENIDGRIAELIAELADLAGDPEAAIDAAREKAATRRYYRNPAGERQNTASDLMKHYVAENHRASEAANYAAAPSPAPSRPATRQPGCGARRSGTRSPRNAAPSPAA
ncbi:hypothetical protein ACFQ3Z_16260 [Streptomyces nogalater]